MGNGAERNRARGRRAHQGWAATFVGASVAMTTHAGAETVATLELTGNCPSEAELATALAARRLPEGAREFKVVLAEHSGGADVTLVHLPDETVLVRRVQSGDCRALADAAAVIVEAYFVELAAQAQQPAATPQGNGPLGAAAPPAAHPGAAPPAASSPPAPPVARPVAATAAPRSTEAAASTTKGPRIELALAGGAELYPQHGTVAAAGQLGLGLWLTPTLELDAHGTLTTSTTSGSIPDRVSRTERRAAVRATGWLGGMPQLAVFGGFGAAFTSVEALDIPGASTKVAWSPVLEGGFVLRQPIGSGLALGGELGCHVLLTQERYVVEPDGDIGKGPRFACALLAGGSWSTR